MLVYLFFSFCSGVARLQVFNMKGFRSLCGEMFHLQLEHRLLVMSRALQLYNPELGAHFFKVLVKLQSSLEEVSV